MDNNQNAVNLFNKYADAYQDKFMNVDLYADSFDLFCKEINVTNASVLELACGPGNITRYLLDKRPDFKIMGTDLAPKMIELAQVNNPSAEFQLMDCRAFGKMNQTFDGIMCGFCLPYLSKEEAIQLIADASHILSPGGVIYISTMEDEYSQSGFRTGSQGDQMFQHFHQADYLTEALIQTGFTIIDLSRKEYPSGEGAKTTDLLIIARK
jgi:predicted TPR repeat methyltransferase